MSIYGNLKSARLPRSTDPDDKNYDFAVRAKEIVIRAKPTVAYEGPHCYIWRGTFKTNIA